MSKIPPFARELLALAALSEAISTEDVDVFRVDGVRCSDATVLDRVSVAVGDVATGGFGQIEVFGDVSGRIDSSTMSFPDVEGDRLRIVLRKARDKSWLYFVTTSGFLSALSDTLLAEPLAIWICEPVEGFSAKTLSVAPWGGSKEVSVPEPPLERPRKLVRDLTGRLTPPQLGPWLLVARPANTSRAFAGWSKMAVERLAYALPYEIRVLEGEDKVALKGLRTALVSIVPMSNDWPNLILDSLTEVVAWIYEVPREAEARFLFLNNQLSLNWTNGLYWPDGLDRTLEESFLGAKEAYAFHLQDQSKDALKTLGDLRKSLQEEVSRSQTATRDLLAALWRDLAIAGVVLALRSPTAPQIAAAEVLRWVTLATACILLVSLGVTVIANWRFNKLSDGARTEWRRKLYAFVPGPEWEKLVEQPIRQGRWVYSLAVPVVVALYVLAAFYLVSVAEPGLLDPMLDYASKLLAR